MRGVRKRKKRERKKKVHTTFGNEKVRVYGVCVYVCVRLVSQKPNYNRHRYTDDPPRLLLPILVAL